MFGLKKLKEIIKSLSKKTNNFAKISKMRTKLKRAKARNAKLEKAPHVQLRAAEPPKMRTGFVNGVYVSNGYVRLQVVNNPNMLRAYSK